MRTFLLGCAAVLAASTLLHAQNELIADDKFSDGVSSWTLQAPPSATAVMDIEKDGDDNVLFVKVEKTSEDTDDVRFYRTFGEINQDQKYRVTFQAKADEATTIVPFIYPQGEGAKVLWRTEIKLEGDWKEYSFAFTGRETASNCVLGFSHLGKLTNKYSFKGITLKTE